MLSILTSCKSFTGPAGPLQCRAIYNWRALHPNIEIILYGKTDGVDAVIREFDVRYIPDIGATAKGIPYFNAIAEHATTHALYDTQLYVNADILLPRKLLDLIPTAWQFPRFLLCGQRIDLVQELPATFSPIGWETRVPYLVRSGQAKIHGTMGSDYFLFPRGMWQYLPPLIIGRGGYDNALIAFCLRQHIPLLDASWVLPVLHQFHDYSHVAGGQKSSYHGKEARQNLRLHGICHSCPTLTDADRIICGNTLRLITGRSNFLRRTEVWLYYKHNLKLLSYLFRALWHLFGGKRWRVPEPDWGALVD